MRDRDASCDSQLPLIACAHSGMGKFDSIHKQKKGLIYVLWLQRLTTRNIGAAFAAAVFIYPIR
jgi:hypothetical protein